MADRIRLDGKVAVITGAAGVIGTATIRLLAERGARIGFRRAGLDMCLGSGLHRGVPRF